MRKAITLALFAALAVSLHAQSTPPNVNTSLVGTGSPTAPCVASLQGQIYVQTDSTIGRIWVCDNSTGSWAWDHLLSAVQGIATTGTITGGTFILGGCTTTTTVTIAGATVGTNTATASPIYVTAPTGNQGLFNLTAWVSAANTVSIQGCSLGALSGVPNFLAKVLLY